nr:adenine phosphoribosyltransferase [Qipengyuania aestuarii]
MKSLVRTIPDFPVAGIQFRDITTLIGHGAGFAATVDWLAEKVRHSGAEAIAGMEARGFIFGASVAARLGLPFLPIRKPGKLPCDTIGVDYALEYGADRLEMDPASVSRDQKVAIVDDLLATGGTACATVELLRQAGADVADAFFVIDLPDLGGAKRLHEAGISVAALMQFDGD